MSSNDVIRDDRLEQIDEAMAKVRQALEGLYVQEQIAVLAQVTGFVLMSAEHYAGKEVGDKARKVFSTSLRNVCAQWRKTFREHGV